MALKNWANTDADQDDADLASNINWQENQAPSTVNNSARAMMTVIKKFWDDIREGTYFIPAANVSVTSNAYTLTTGQGIGSLKEGIRIAFIAKATNTGAVTVNVDSLGATAVKSYGDPLPSGAISTGDVVVIWHDGTDFELVSPRRALPDVVTLLDTDAGATSGPFLTLLRDSASPADNDVIGEIDFQGRDSASNLETYASLIAIILDTTSGTEDGLLRVLTKQGGSATPMLNFAQGVYTHNATGGDKGADTINASSLYEDGTAVSDKYFTRDPDYDSGEQTVSVDTTLTLAHSLGAIPRMVEVILRCKTTSDGYTAGQEVIFNNHVGGLSDQGVTVSRDATNVVVVQGGVISVINPSTNNNDDISTTNWRWVIRAWT